MTSANTMVIILWTILLLVIPRAASGGPSASVVPAGWSFTDAKSKQQAITKAKASVEFGVFNPLIKLGNSSSYRIVNVSEHARCSC